MQALILDDDPKRQTLFSTALMGRGFQVLNAYSVTSALIETRRTPVDLLVMPEHVDGALSHEVAMTAERRSPYVATIMLTNRAESALQELYELLPSLYSALGHQTQAELIAKLGVSGVSGVPRGAAPQVETQMAMFRHRYPRPVTPQTQPATPHPMTPEFWHRAPERVAS